MIGPPIRRHSQQRLVRFYSIPSLVQIQSILKSKAAVIQSQMKSKAAILEQKSITTINTLKESFWNASSTLNKVTGYDIVQERKRLVLEKDQHLQHTRQQFKLAKEEYESLIEKSKSIQRDLDHLRDRKLKSIEDINQMTRLYELLLSIEQNQVIAKQEFKKVTEEFENAQLDYLNEMRERYVEEQMFSEKIRQTSTWWTWGLISTHLILFLMIQLIIEPRKRQRLKQELEKVVEDGLGKNREIFTALMNSNGSKELESPETVGQVVSKEVDEIVDQKEIKEVETEPHLWYSNERIFQVLENAVLWQGITIGTLVAFTISWITK